MSGQPLMGLHPAALRWALDRAGFAIVATGTRQCLSESGGQESAHLKTMGKPSSWPEPGLASVALLAVAIAAMRLIRNRDRTLK